MRKNPRKRKVKKRVARKKVKTRKRVTPRKKSKKRITRKRVKSRKKSKPKKRRKPSGPGGLSHAAIRRIASLPPKKVDFGKRKRIRGKYVVEVLDERGKKVAQVPWRPSIRADVREIARRGEAVKRGVRIRRPKKIPLLKIPGWTVDRVDPASGAVDYVMPVYRGRSPIGEDAGEGAESPPRFRDAVSADERRWNIRHRFNLAFDRIRPQDWKNILDRLPKRVRDSKWTAVGLQIRGIKPDTGEKIEDVYPPNLVIREITHPRGRTEFQRRWYWKGSLYGLLSNALMRIARRYGYGASVVVTSVYLVISLSSAIHAGMPVLLPPELAERIRAEEEEED